MVNSQTPRAAMMLAAKKSLMLNVMKTPRHAIAAMKENQIATPLPSAPLPAESLTQNAIQAQANAHLVTQQLTKTAPKPRLHVTKNAQLCLSLNVTIPQESAAHALRAVQVVSQMLHAQIHAHQDQNPANFGCAAGIQLFQNVSKMKRVL
jgi:hypothetical protein